MAWVRMARATSGTVGSINATESTKAWVYRPKSHVVYMDRNIRLVEEKTGFPKVSSLLDARFRGVIGKELGFTLAAEARTRLSGATCWVF